MNLRLIKASVFATLASCSVAQPAGGFRVEPRSPTPAEAVDHPDRSTQGNVACSDGREPFYEVVETSVLVKCEGEGVKWKVVCRQPPALTKTADGGVKIHCS
jgi:hypothetical protein